VAVDHDEWPRPDTRRVRDLAIGVAALEFDDTEE
jgi:hypothetical protein